MHVHFRTPNQPNALFVPMPVRILIFFGLRSALHGRSTGVFWPCKLLNLYSIQIIAWVIALMSIDNNLFQDESLFKLVIDASPAAMLIANRDGAIVLANQQALEYFGYSREELLGLKIENLIPQAHRRDHAAHRAQFFGCPTTRPMALGRDLYACRKDGSEFPVDISLHPIQTSAGLLVLANILDSTDRLRARQAEEAKNAMERLSMLGQVAGGVAHEIRTPLCVIGNAAYFLEMFSQELDSEGKDCISEIKREVAKANGIVSELLEYTRDTPVQPIQFSVVNAIKNAMKSCPPPPETQLDFDGEHIEARVNADQAQIERLLMNLLRNAYQSIGGAGAVRVALEVDGHSLWIDVVDDGPGVAKGFENRLFEPLFTTKSSGFGLGLAVSRRYAERNGGTLSYVNMPQRGATFRLTLPVAR